MDNAQARFLLHSARPDGRDDADPVFAEALEQARRDPALARWLEEERRLDTLLAAKLAALEPPADLKAALLTAPKVVRFASAPSPLSPLSRRVSEWLAIAAAIALLLVPPVGWAVRKARPSFGGYQKDIYAQIVSGQVEKLGLVDPRLGVLKEWLAAQGAPMPAHLPPAVLEAPGLGCRTFTWNGAPVAQICFRMKDGQVAHLFVIGRSHWQAAPPDGTPDFHHHGDWSMACWRDDGKTYILAKAGPQAEIEKLLL